jgi:hypothetical protein
LRLESPAEITGGGWVSSKDIRKGYGNEEGRMIACAGEADELEDERDSDNDSKSETGEDNLTRDDSSVMDEDVDSEDAEEDER